MINEVVYTIYYHKHFNDYCICNPGSDLPYFNPRTCGWEKIAKDCWEKDFVKLMSIVFAHLGHVVFRFSSS